MREVGTCVFGSTYRAALAKESANVNNQPLADLAPSHIAHLLGTTGIWRNLRSILLIVEAMNIGARSRGPGVRVQAGRGLPACQAIRSHNARQATYQPAPHREFHSFLSPFSQKMF